MLLKKLFRKNFERETSAEYTYPGKRFSLLRPGFVLAQGGPAELNLSPKIFIGLIYCNYAAHEHVGVGFAAFGSQVVSLCSESAESDRIDYYALSIHYLRVVEPACVPSSPNPRLIWPSQPRCG